MISVAMLDKITKVIFYFFVLVSIWGLYSLLKVDKIMFLVSFSFAVAGLVCLHKARLKYLEYWKLRKLPGFWKKLRTSYEKDDFGAIKAVIPKIRKIEDDPVLLLVEAEMHLFGKTVFQSYFKAIELYEEVSKLKLPPKTKWEKNVYTKKYAEKTKASQKKKKKENYIKKIKGRAIKIWNDNELSHIKERYHRIIHTEEPIEMKEV